MQRILTTPVVLTLAVWSVIGAPALVADAGDDEGPWSKLEIHGYLNQAFAISDGHQILGIPDDGTGEYRTGALQIKYALTDQDQFIMQLSHERLGASPASDLRDDLEVDWLFYQRQFTDATSVAVGRVPLPIGIYNKIRDVGTLLPFFRPSFTVYGDGAFTSETVDGLVLTQRFARDSPWSLEADLYYGNWKRIETNVAFTPSAAWAEVDNAAGIQLWLDTPLSGLRFGAGANRYDVSGGLFRPPGIEDREENLHLSCDGNFERVVVRSEYQRQTHARGFHKGWYVELVVRVGERLRLMANYEKTKLKFTAPITSFNVDFFDDLALGLSYAFRHNLVLKSEYHWHEGFDIEDQPLNPAADERAEVQYGILSLAVHF